MQEVVLSATGPLSQLGPAREEVWRWGLPSSEGVFFNPISPVLSLIHSLTHLKAVYSWAINFTSLCFTSFVCKMGVQMVLISESCEDSLM